MFSCATNRVPKDLAAYVNQGILNISELESKSLIRYASVNCKRCDITDEDIRDTLKHEVIPNYKRFLYLLREINPETDEVRALHADFIQGAEMIYGGFKIKMIGLESKDPNLIRAAEDNIDKGMVKTYRWHKKLKALAKEQGITKREKKWYSSWY
jgi:hypothetical protein